MAAKKKSTPKGKKPAQQLTTDIIEAYQCVFNSVEGQVVLNDLMDFGFFMEPPVLGEEGQRQIGRRAVCQHIIDTMGKDPNEIIKIIAEQTEKRRDEYAIFKHG